jgi:hypothetical protein
LEPEPDEHAIVAVRTDPAASVLPWKLQVVGATADVAVPFTLNPDSVPAKEPRSPDPFEYDPVTLFPCWMRLNESDTVWPVPDPVVKVWVPL